MRVAPAASPEDRFAPSSKPGRYSAATARLLVRTLVLLAAVPLLIVILAALSPSGGSNVLAKSADVALGAVLLGVMWTGGLVFALPAFLIAFALELRLVRWLLLTRGGFAIVAGLFVICMVGSALTGHGFFAPWSLLGMRVALAVYLALAIATCMSDALLPTASAARPGARGGVNE